MGTSSRKVPTLEVWTVAYGDDGYIKTKLSVTFHVLAELKRVLKTDTGMDLNVSKTSILPNSMRGVITSQ
jgi:hypothetical protein